MGGVGAAWRGAQEREAAEGRRRDTRVWGSRRREQPLASVIIDDKWFWV